MKPNNILIALFAAVSLSLAAEAALAMPIEQDYYAEHGVTSDGRLDIRDVDDIASEMEVRLSRQVMVLQHQIDALRSEIDRLNAEVEGLK